MNGLSEGMLTKVLTDRRIPCHHLPITGLKQGCKGATEDWLEIVVDGTELDDHNRILGKAFVEGIHRRN